MMKSSAPFFRIDIIYMNYLNMNYFPVMCLSINYEKLAVNTTLTTTEHFLAKKLYFRPSDIIQNSIELKWQCLEHTLKFLIHDFCISSILLREISSPRLDHGTCRP